MTPGEWSNVQTGGFCFFVLLSASLVAFSCMMLFLDFLLPNRVEPGQVTFFASVITFILGKWTGLAAGKFMKSPASAALAGALGVPVRESSGSSSA